MPFLSIIIPAYNEAERIPETLALVRDYVEKQPFEIEVLVVNDGSKDSTADVVTKYMERFPQLKLVDNTVNKGKGGSVKQGMLLATGEYRLFMDADNSTPITEFDTFLPLLKTADILIGSRYINPESIKVKQPWQRRLLSRVSNRAIQWAVLPGIVDTQCGFKLFSAKAAEAIFPKQQMMRWSFDVELLTIARQQGFSIKEVAVDWYDAKDSRVQTTKAAINSFRDLRTIRKRVKQKMYV